MELSSVEALVQSDKVRLNWQAANEMPNTRFKIQVSNNKITWRTVGILSSQGGKADQFNKYVYTDALASKGGKLFYRISIVDALGNEKMKRDIEVRVVGNEKMETLTASLTSGQLNVDIDLPSDAKVLIEMFDIHRKRVFIQEFPYKRGRHNVPINVKHLLEGYYLLEISHNEQLIRKNVRITKPTLPTN
jgi:hypothetical protein